MEYVNGHIHFDVNTFWGMASFVFIIALGVAIFLGPAIYGFVSGFIRAYRGEKVLSTWADEQLPPDETLRVLAGNEPSWGFKLKRAGLWLWGAFLALLTWAIVLVIFIEFQGHYRWIVVGLCFTCLIAGFVVGVKTDRPRQ